MSILWCGGEEIDFPNGIAAEADTSITHFRAGYARCGVSSQSSFAPARSNPFPGGAVTSCWMSWRFFYSPVHALAPFGGLCKDAATAAGIIVGNGNGGDITKIGLYKSDGISTRTLLAQEPGNSMSSGLLSRFDLQVINYGVTATLNLWLNGVLLVTYTGDVTVSGVTSLSCASISIGQDVISEVIVANEDTRGWLGLVTMAPNANGTTQNWSNPGFAVVNPIDITTTVTAAYTNTTAQDNQYNLIDPPFGTYTVGAVKAVASSARSSSATATQVSLGVKNGATTSVATAHTTTTAYETDEDIFTTDPTTGVAWAPTDLATLQLTLRSA